MPRNLAYWRHAPDIPNQIAQINRYLRSSGLDPGLQHLILLRVSQINECAYCVDLHAREALQGGEDAPRIDCLAAWRGCDLYTGTEKAALDWAEALTELENDRRLDEAYASVSGRFGDRDLADLTFLIATMNAWNRMGRGLGRKPAASTG